MANWITAAVAVLTILDLSVIRARSIFLAVREARRQHSLDPERAGTSETAFAWSLVRLTATLLVFGKE